MQPNPGESQAAERRFSAPQVREVGPDAVLRWLRQGWHDLRASGWPSLMHGLIVAAVSIVIVEIGCDYVQGYWVGCPVPLADVLARTDD